MQVHDLVASFSQVADADDSMARARGVLETLRDDLDILEKTLSFMSGVGGNAQQIFYRSPRLSLLKVSFPQGRRTPPHDHGTWASILVFSGVEKNTLYRVDDAGGLKRASEVVLERGSILPMRADTAHVAESVGDAPAVGLHVYGGDIMGLARRMWDPDTLEQHPLEWEHYEELARKASMMEGAP